MNNNRSKLNELLTQSGAGKDTAQKLQRIAERNPNVAAALNQLSEQDIAKIRALLNDKEAASRILATSQAQELLGKLKG